MRVGAGAGIGAKWLAREDSHVVGMLGSGGMARTFIEAFTCVRDIRLCKVYSPNARHREDSPRKWRSGSISKCVRSIPPRSGARRRYPCLRDRSMSPVYDAEWIEPGMHVTNLGRREMPDAAAAKFDVVIRQGTSGLQMKQTERFQAERGHSPAAYRAARRRS